MSQVKEGEILAGKYRVERVLGAGGMGVVVSALHLQLDEQVAIKFLLPEALANPDAVARFAREARAAVKIRSEHVARVKDVGTLESGAPYLVMEFLHGRDLSQVVRERGPLPVAEAVEYLLQACEALAEAHALGIVHRDLKPANLFLTRRADGSPCVKVLDFGISKVTNPSASGPDMDMTRTRAILGSPLYMSPEQMASARDVDVRSDVWAVGTVLFELLTGRVPFEADNMPQLCALILQHPPPRARSVRPDIPEALEHVILRSLEKNREHRYQNIAELAAALAEFVPDAGPRSAERIHRVLGGVALASSATSLARPKSAVPAPPSHDVPTKDTWERTHATRSSRLVWFALGALALAGIAVAVVVSRSDAPPAPVVEPGKPSESPRVSAAPTVEPERTAPTEAALPSAPASVVPPPSATAESTPAKAGARPAPKPARPKPSAAPAKPSAPAPAPEPARPFDPLSERR